MQFISSRSQAVPASCFILTKTTSREERVKKRWWKRSNLCPEKPSLSIFISLNYKNPGDILNEVTKSVPSKPFERSLSSIFPHKLILFSFIFYHSSLLLTISTYLNHSLIHKVIHRETLIEVRRKEQLEQTDQESYMQLTCCLRQAIQAFQILDYLALHEIRKTSMSRMKACVSNNISFKSFP